MSYFKVTPEELMTTSGRINDAGGRLESEIGAIRQLVAGTKSFWEGSAQGTYDSLMEKWNRSATTVHEALVATVDALKKAADDYSTTEQGQVQRFGS